MTIYFGSSTDEDLIAELEQRGYFCAKAQEPVGSVEVFPFSNFALRTVRFTEYDQLPVGVTKLYAAPIPPVREPLSDAQINEIRLVHGVTSSGRGIREVAQVISFARAIEAAIKEQK